VVTRLYQQHFYIATAQLLSDSQGVLPGHIFITLAVTEAIKTRELPTLLATPGLQCNGLVTLHIRIETGAEQNAGGCALQVLVGQFRIIGAS